VNAPGHETVVHFSSDNGVGMVSFDRPPANAYDLAFHQQFNEAINAADASPATRVVIVRSAITRFFCAGADVKAFSANSMDDNRKMVASARAALAKIEASGKPFIALLEGHTLGGGLEIAMACDVRFAAEGDYKLGLPEVRLGLLPGNGGSQRLPRILGPSKALMLLLSGENIDPDEALRIGLVDRLFPRNKALDEAMRFAGQVAAAAPLAVTAAKRAVRDGLGQGLQEALELESRLVDELYDTQDAKEGFRAAVEKRSPRYTGK
jgi:enoyl-CoA hydratase/carnithine racemase